MRNIAPYFSLREDELELLYSNSFEVQFASVSEEINFENF